MLNNFTPDKYASFAWHITVNNKFKITIMIETPVLNLKIILHMEIICSDKANLMDYKEKVTNIYWLNAHGQLHPYFTAIDYLKRINSQKWDGYNNKIISKGTFLQD